MGDFWNDLGKVVNDAGQALNDAGQAIGNAVSDVVHDIESDPIANAAANVVAQAFVPGAPPIPLVPTPAQAQDVIDVLTGQPAQNISTGTSAVVNTDNDRAIVLDLIDALQKPPPLINAEYVKIVQRVAAWLGQTAVGAPSSVALRNTWDQSLFPEQAPGTTSGHVLTGDSLSSREDIRNMVYKARNDILNVSSQLSVVVPIAVTFGNDLGPNPFTVAMSFNNLRLGFSPVQGLSNSTVEQIINGLRQGLAAIERYFNQVAVHTISDDAAQLSSATLSLEGFGGSGNTSVDLGKITPEQEAIKAQKALDALSVLDFTKRVPHVLFTAFYQPSDDPQGIIVGWKRVPDASGYVVTRRNIFNGKVQTYTVTNEDAKYDTARLADYVKTWVLSFYDAVQPSTVLTFLDTSFAADAYYYYNVQAYQLQNTHVGAIFTVETSPTVFSPTQKNDITQQLGLLSTTVITSVDAFDFNNVNTRANISQNFVSPYPVLSNSLFGTPDYDWLLAAINTRASINRGDARSVTKQYSYLGAQVGFLFDAADKGKFVVPKGRDFSAAEKNITDAISKFGMNQVIQTLLEETGAIYHFDGSEPNDDYLFQKANITDPDESALLLTVAESIDPETATLDMKTLTSNMPTVLSGHAVLPGNVSKKKVSRNNRSAKSAEIQVPHDVDRNIEVNPSSEIENLQQLANTSSAIDLTTVEGLGTLMRVIRIYSDQGGNRGAPSVQAGKTPRQPGAVVVAPPPPAISTVQPVSQPRTGNVVTDAQQGVTAVGNDLSQGASNVANDLSQGNIGGAVNDAGQAIGNAVNDAGKALENGAKDVADFFGIHF